MCFVFIFNEWHNLFNRPDMSITNNFYISKLTTSVITNLGYCIYGWKQSIETFQIYCKSGKKTCLHSMKTEVKTI